MSAEATPSGGAPRRRRRLVGWWALVLVAGSIVVTIGLPLFGVGAFHASDVLQAYPPWRADAPAGFRVDNANVSDTVDATIPMRAAWRRRIRAGDFPLWESYAAGGAPLSAIPNASTLSPLNVPFLLAPLWWAPALSKLLEMLVAAGFTYLLARRWGLGRIASGTAALVFMNSGFQIVWTNWPQSHVGALVPALFWAVDRGLSERRVWALWPVPVVSATMWFEGFPAVTLWAHAAVAVYALVVLAPAGSAGRVAGVAGRAAAVARSALRSLVSSWQRVVAVAVAMLAGAGVAALQLAPFAFRLSDLDLSYRAGKQIGALQWRSVITLLVPHAFGTPEDHVYYGIRHIVEIQSFVGAVALVLVLAAAVWFTRARVSRRVHAYLWVTLIVSVVLIYVGGPLLTAIQAVPLVGANAIGRLRSLLGLLLALLAGIGLQALADTVTDRRRSWWLLELVVLLVAGAGGTLWSVGRTAAHAGYPDYFRHALIMPAVMLGLITLTAVWLARRGAPPAGAPDQRRWRGLVVAVVPLLVAIETVSVARPFFPRIPESEFYPVTAAHRFVEANLGHDRIAAGGYAMYPGTTVLYGIRSVTAHTLTTQPYAELLQAVDWWVFLHNRTLPILRSREVAAASPVLDRMGARFFVSPPEAPIFGREEVVTTDEAPQRIPPGASLHTAIDPGPLRGVRLRLHEPSNPTTPTFVRVEVLDGARHVVASGKRRILPRTPSGDFDVAVLPTDGTWPATAGAPGSWTLRVTPEAASGHVVLGTARPGVAAVRLVRPVDDGLQVVFDDGVVVYRREHALPRIRWAGRTEVVDNPQLRVLDLTRGVPADTVVLDTPGQAAGGGTARLTVTEDSGDAVRAEVDAGSAGYLVVADAIQHDWVATVDGTPAAVVDADHAFGAVHVPAGRHVVALHYVPAGWSAGQVVTWISLGFVLLAAALALRDRRCRRRRYPHAT